MSTPVAFAKFGQLFLETLLCERLIEAQVRGAIAARTKIDIPMQAWGAADLFTVGPVKRSIGVDEIAFEIPIVLTLNLTTGLGHMPPVEAHLTLRLVFGLYANLVIAGALSLPGDDIDMKFDSKNPIDNVILVPLLKTKMLEKIKGSLAQAAPALIIDLEAILLEQAYGGDVFKVGGKDSNSVALGRMPGQVLPRDAIATATLAPNRKVESQIFLRAGEKLRLKVYGQIDAIPELGFVGAGLSVSLRPNRRGADEVSNDAAIYDAWKPVWARIDIPENLADDDAWYIAPVGGAYKLTISTYATNDTGVNVRIFQERRFSPDMALPGTRISFAQFGQNLFNIGLSSAFFLQQFQVKLMEQVKDGVITVPWKGSPLGDVVFLIAPKIDKVQDAASDKPEFEALRRVTVSATVKCMRGNERLFQVPISAELILAISASDAPSIDVSLKKVGKIAFDMKSFTAINAATETLVKGLLDGSVGDFAEKAILDLANKAIGGDGFVLQSQKILDVVEAKISAAKPGGIGPKPVGSGLDTGAQILKPGACATYVLPLEKNNLAEIHLEMRPAEAPSNIGAYAWLAVCDENSGILQDDKHVFMPRSKAGWTKSLRFRAFADGTYQVAVRSNPMDGETWKQMSYQLKIRMVS